MIFYFSGTGNSYAAALKMQNENEKIYNIAECVEHKQFEYEADEDEAVGIVFPVYFGGLPTIVSYFIDQLTFAHKEPDYIYAVMTCGGSSFGAAYMLNQRMEFNGHKLSAIFSVTMVDNYVLLYKVDEADVIDDKLDMADAELDVIHDKVLARVITDAPAKTDGLAFSSMGYPLYRNGRKTKPFTVNDKCVGCGVCSKNCPSKAIEMVDGKPVWVKDRCVLCLACINRCQAEAIEYGKKTKNKGRYVNPVYR